MNTQSIDFIENIERNDSLQILSGNEQLAFMTNVYSTPEQSTVWAVGLLLYVRHIREYIYEPTEHGNMNSMNT